MSFWIVTISDGKISIFLARCFSGDSIWIKNSSKLNWGKLIDPTRG